MPATATELDVITRRLQVAASPEVVYGFFTDAERLAQWMGRRVQADPTPGGLLRVDYNGFDIMRGSFIELVPHSRVVWGWGWESLVEAGTPPGASMVEITLEPDGDGTLLLLRHSGLRGAELGAHDEGWDRCLALLAGAVAGTPGHPFPSELTAAEEFASQLNTLLIRLVEVVSGCPDAAWRRAVADDGRTVAAVAGHIAAHIELAHFVVATANGERSPLADVTSQAIDGGNAEAARQAASVTRAEVVARVRELGPAAVAALRVVPSATLVRAQAMGFAGGAEMSAAAVAEGPLLEGIREHLAGIEAALVR